MYSPLWFTTTSQYRQFITIIFTVTEVWEQEQEMDTKTPRASREQAA